MVKETEEQEKEVYDLSEIAKYRPIALGPELAKADDRGSLEETLKTFYEKGLGVKKSRDIEDAVESVMTSPQSLSKFIGNFNGRYQEALHSQKIKDLRQFYDSAFKKYYDEKVLPEVEKVFESEETYGSILDKYHDAELDSKKVNISDKDREKAKKIMEALSKIIKPLDAFENLELDKLRVPIKEKSLKKSLNADYEKKEEAA